MEFICKQNSIIFKFNIREFQAFINKNFEFLYHSISSIILQLGFLFQNFILIDKIIMKEAISHFIRILVFPYFTFFEYQ